MKALHLRTFGIINVDIISQQKKSPRVNLPDPVPHPLICRHVSRSSSESDSELIDWRILLQRSARKGPLPRPAFGIKLPRSGLPLSKIQKHFCMSRIHSLARGRAQVGDRFLVFPLQDQLQRMGMNTLTLLSLFRLLIIHPRL